MSFKPHFTDVPLNKLSYYKTGGKTLGVLAPRSTQEVKESISWIKSQKKPFYVLGGGTNSLISDEPWDGYVISFHLMNKIVVANEEIHVEAGVVNSDLVLKAYESGIGDLSWMYRLPGQIGGTVRMNARCYGGEISNVVSQVTAISQQGELRRYEDISGIFKGYKDTLFMDNGDIICEVTISLQPLSEDDLIKVKAKMDFCETDRESKGQFLYPTCGCVFKNSYDPRVSVSSGMLLEKSGAKHQTYGGAQVSDGHANFVYNKSASSSDILNLSFKMRDMVYETFGVWLDYEMEILGELSEVQKRKLYLEKQFSDDEGKSKYLMAVREEFQKKTLKR